MNKPRIILVGHCGPDSYALKTAVARMVPGADIVLTMDERSFDRELPTADLLLINRVLDGDYQDHAGVDLIRRLGAHPPRPVPPALMLVSNFPDAQAEAVAAGALPGFGKRDLYAEETTRKVREAVESREPGRARPGPGG